MDNQEEDLNYNAFFKALRNKFNGIYQEAEKNCWIICVPSAESCSGLIITKDMIETHILVPSPFFAGEYTTLNKKTVEIDENIISTKNGFPVQKKAKIVFEELFYNKQYKPFRVLCISHPLEGEQKSSEEEQLKFPKTRSTKDCETFLKSYPEDVIVLSKVMEQIKEFNHTYVFVKGFEEHAKKKVQAICEQAFESLLCANVDFRKLYNNNSPKLVELNQIVESYVVGEMHDRLFEGLATINSREDDDMLSIFESLQHLSPSDLGLRKELCCPMPEAIGELKRLDEHNTPLEKIFCLHAVSNLITKAIAKNMSADLTSDSVITTDDLIPLIAFVIIKSKAPKLMTNLYYMENFTFCNISATSLGFTLVTFRAAVEYLKSDHIDPTFIKSSPSLSFATPASSKSSSNTLVNSNQSNLSNSSESIRGHTRQRSSSNGKNEMLRSSSNDKPEGYVRRPLSSFQLPPEVISLKQDDEEIGDFLSQLRNQSWSSRVNT